MLLRLGYAALCVLASAVAGCAGVGQALGFPQNMPTCGPPPPVPAPFLFFAYPGDGAQNVPTTIGELVFVSFGVTTVQLSAPSGPVQTGPLQPAPSALPSPLATPPPPQQFGSGAPYVAASVGPLAPATKYSVSFSFQDWNGIPPSCTGTITRALGSFTTR